MAIAQEQKSFGTRIAGDSGVDVTATFGSTPTEGNLLIALVGGGANETVTISGFTLAIGYWHDPSYSYTGIFYKVAGASESTTVTASPASADDHILAIFEYSGIDTTSPLDETGSAGQQSTGTSLAVAAAAATDTADELAISCMHLWLSAGDDTCSYSDSFVEQYDLFATGSGDCNFFVATKILTAIGTPSCTFTWGAGTSEDVSGTIATFRSGAQSETTSGTLNAGGSISATVVKYLTQVARPTSTITAGDWDTGPTTGQALHTYAGDASDTTYIEDTTA